MVESVSVDNVGQLLQNLNQATTKLTEINQQKQPVTSQQCKELVKALKNCNSTLDPAFWADKKLAPEAMNTTIERALMALALFKVGAEKNVDEAIASIFSVLSDELRSLKINLKGLRQHRIGRRVEKTQKSKETANEG